MDSKKVEIINKNGKGLFAIVIYNVAHLLAEKWERHYSELRGFVRGRMALSVVHSNSLRLRRTQMGKAARFAGQDGAALSGLGRVRD